MVLALKITLILLLLFIIISLVKALFHMVKQSPSDKNDQPPLSYYLGRRVLISALVVILLIIALLSGWIEPNHRPY